ncbi:MAG: hypothetical protein H0X31_08005 [Nostocaceae cyanobacterium]|nr:hypothetical protein [Nostocaceae cyanobacterium]
MKDAKKCSDELYLVCLDELNLEKIETYGAELLSSLEYSRSEQRKQCLRLYSESIAKPVNPNYILVVNKANHRCEYC